MSIVLQMTVKLFTYSADVFQPFVKADLVLGLLWDGDKHSPYGSGRHDAPHSHYLSVCAAHHIICYSAQR